VSVGLLLLLLSRIEALDVAAALAGARLGPLAATAGLLGLALHAKARRWTVIVRALPGPPAKPRAVRDAYYAGVLANSTLPARLGELGKAGLLARESGLPLPAILSTVLLERVLDVSVLATFLGLALLLGELPQGLPAWVAQTARTLGLAAPLGVLALLAVATWSARWSADDARGPWGQLAARAAEGLALLRSPYRAGLAVVITAVVWSLEACAVAAALAAFGAHAPASGVVIQTAAAAFASGAPSAPSALGVHQWVTLLVLQPYGIEEAAAVATSLTVTATTLIWSAPLGLRGLWRLQGPGRTGPAPGPSPATASAIDP
jgi:uncharacterized membrane protein YbhN (UPF0104 family)